MCRIVPLGRIQTGYKKTILVYIIVMVMPIHKNDDKPPNMVKNPCISQKRLMCGLPITLAIDCISMLAIIRDIILNVRLSRYSLPLYKA